MYIKNNKPNSSTELNIIPIFNHVQKYVKNESLAWECVSEAYLTLDTTRDIAQQASYMYSKVIHIAINKYRKSQKTICFSNLDTENNEGKANSFIANLQYETFQNALSDTKLITRLLNKAPKDYVKPLALVLNAIFEGRIGQKAKITAGSIRQLFLAVGYKPTNNVDLMNNARKCYELLTSENFLDVMEG